jgi:Flp pilus assembly protein TadG
MNLPAITPAQRCLASVAALAQRLRRREDGIAAVEFALILPIMATMFIGAVEMSWAVSADRRVSQVSSAAGDVTARSQANLTTDEVKQYSQAAAWLMNPFDSTKTKIKISAVSSGSSASTITEKWSCTYDAQSDSMNPACACSTAAYTPPTGLITKPLEGLIVSEVTFKYKPLVLTFDWFMRANVAQDSGGFYTMTEKLHFKPRALCPGLIISNTLTCGC